MLALDRNDRVEKPLKGYENFTKIRGWLRLEQGDQRVPLEPE